MCGLFVGSVVLALAAFIFTDYKVILLGSAVGLAVVWLVRFVRLAKTPDPPTWSRTLSGEPFQRPISVTGSSADGAEEPSEADLSLIEAIRARFPELNTAAIEALGETLAGLDPPVLPEELVFGDILLDSKNNSFTFFFEVPTRSEDVGFPFYVRFDDFKITEADLAT